MKEIFTAIAITLCILLLGAFVVYYFFAPPPPLTFEEAAVRRTQDKEQAIDAVVAAQQEAEFNASCGPGWSGRVCRLKQGTCDTALGAYFCFVEGRETGDL